MNLRHLFSVVILLLCCFKSEAQYPSYQKINTQLFPTLYLLLANPTAIWNELEPQQEDMIWDSNIQGYRGIKLEKINYLAISKNAFSTMEVVMTESKSNNFLPTEFTENNIQEWLEALPSSHNSRSFIGTFQEGKLISYKAEELYPEREAYSKTEETFLYSKDQITHTQSTISSGHGSSTNCCKNLPNFLIHKSSLNKSMTFDHYGHLSKSENLSNEAWDTCTCGGPKTFSITIERNEKGQPTKVSHSNSKLGGLVYETLYDYQVSTFPQFLDQVKGLELYAYYNSKEILNWHLEHQATFVERISKTTKSYSVYNPVLMQDILKPDSPVVRTEIYYTILDDKRQPLAEWLDKIDTKGPFYFYDYEEKELSRTLLTWKLPALVQAKNVDHCAPLYDPQPQQMNIEWKLYTLDTKTIGSNKIHSYATANQKFTGTFTNALDRKTQKNTSLEIQMLEDEHGLIRYLANKQYNFKISYRK